MVRVLVLGAHPDDAEFFAGGLLSAHALAGSSLRLVSVTNGQSGHHEIPSPELIVRRRKEAEQAGKAIRAPYVTWDFPDGALQPTLDVRNAIIREIRTFQPDLVLTHRPFDYHPDHRAVGQAVQDASYMVLVPKIVPDVPPPAREPIVAYMVDLFTRPTPLRPDVVLDVSHHWDSVLAMLHCHRSQFYEWMPWIDKIVDQVPVSTNGQNIEDAEKAWLASWYASKTEPRIDRFWDGKSSSRPRLIEAYEISEYAGKLTSERMATLFSPAPERQPMSTA